MNAAFAARPSERSSVSIRDIFGLPKLIICWGIRRRRELNSIGNTRSDFANLFAKWWRSISSCSQVGVPRAPEDLRRFILHAFVTKSPDCQHFLSACLAPG